MKDFSRIPDRRPAARRRRRWPWAAAAAVVVLFVSVWFGRPAWLYLSNRGELELVPQNGLVSLIVLQNDAGVIDGNKLEPMVTDWLDMRTSHTLKLPPGKYQLNAGLAPPGPRIIHWAVTTSGASGSRSLLVPGAGGELGWSVIVTVGRGERVRVQPVLAKPRPAPPDPPTPQDRDGWVQLFNGKDLTGWKTHLAPEGGWAVEDGVLVGRGGHHYLFTRRDDYENFRLRVEARINAGGNSGVFFRCRPTPGAQPGYEAEIDGTGKERPTGSLWRYPVRPWLLMAAHSPAVPAGEWFRLEASAVADRITVRVNGMVTADVTDATHARGHVALQAFQGQTRVEFRKIEIKELPPGNVAAPPQAVAPFDAGRAKELQSLWAKHLGTEPEFVNSIGMKFRLIPPGEFTMGSGPDEFEAVRKHVDEWAVEYLRAEGPPRRVAISRPYFLGTTEVSVGQFREFVARTGYKTTAERTGKGGRALLDGGQIERRPEWTWRHTPWSSNDLLPVVQMSLEDARAFCRWLSGLDGRTYAVPTEEQWEYACRAGTTTYWYTGNDPKDVAANGWVLDNGGAETHACGTKRPNPFGLYDLYGNVEELCDWERDGKHLTRGGSVNHSVWLSRSASRWTFFEGDMYFRHGFRVAIVGELTPKADGSPVPGAADKK